MRTRVCVCALPALLSLAATPGAAQESGLSLEEVLARVRERAPAALVARVRERAPAALVARARSAEADARLVGARRRWRSNPTLEAALGPRTTGDARFGDVEIGVSQALEPGGRRAARVAAAEAGVAESRATADEEVRLALREATLAFHDALRAQERVRLLAEATEVANDVLRVAERRYDAGDVAILDVNLARAAAARAHAAEASARAASIGPLAELRVLLGMSAEEALRVRGSLAARRRPRRDTRHAGRPPASLDDLPALRALDAAIREAEADQALARAQATPEIGVSARYAKEEASHVVLGGLTLTLPLFERGQALGATAAAQLARLHLERRELRREVEVRVRAALDRYTEARCGLERLERDALPGLEENETLARRSYEVGELTLPEWLVLRRELLDTRLEHVDGLYGVAAAALDVDFASGALR